MKEIQVVIQKRKILSGDYTGFIAIKEIECRNDADLRQANRIYSTDKYNVVCTHIIKRSVADDYVINFDPS